MLSGLLLALSFPPFESAQIAWVALIPLLLALLQGVGKHRGEIFRPKPFFLLGFTSGVIFWLVSMSWLLRLFETSPAPAILIVLGWVGLSAYCALYCGVFAMSVVWVARKIGTEKLWQTLLLTVLIPVLWVGGEMARSAWLTGFPWNLLGISQYRNLMLIQCAQWVGVPGVSALVMVVNAGIAFTVMRYLPSGAEKKYRPNLELFVALMAIVLCFRSGMGLIRQFTPGEIGSRLRGFNLRFPR